MAGEAQGLEIQVAPQTLVVSSGGDNVTIHTDFPNFPEEGAQVTLEIEPEGGNSTTVKITDEFLDDCGFYVVRCDRQAAAQAVGDFEGKFTTAVVTLCIDGDCDSEEIKVRK
jgi:hypothetical protein